MATTTKAETKVGHLFEQITENAEFVRLRDEITKGGKIVSLAGLTSGAAKALVLSAVQRETKKTLVVVVESNRELEDWNSDICTIADLTNSQFKIQNLASKIVTLPSSDADVYAGVSPHAETLERRALALWQLTTDQTPDFLLLTARGLIAKTVTPDELKNLGAHLKKDRDFAFEDLTEKLIAGGYVREEPVGGVGQFSSRGGILDVWSPGSVLPVRIEFWGDTVDSIREFEPDTQLSTRQLTEISLAPMREFAATSEDFRDWAVLAASRFADEKFARALADRTQFAAEGESFSGWEFLFPILRTRSGSAFDFLPENSVLVFDEPAQY